jgi:monofunctional biosynthetic peptidoglycan transglycosylase
MYKNQNSVQISPKRVILRLQMIRLLKTFLWILSLPLIPVILYKWINPPYTSIQWSQSELRGERGTWLELEEIPDMLEKAAVAAEDQRFFDHSGFDFSAIEKALESNKKGKTIRGASTISQQTAKNIFLWEGRSWLRKGLETYMTFWMELFWSKKRILEVYLNVAEMGRGAFGVDEAAKYYYKKEARHLSNQECINIISMLPCPRTCGINHPISRKRQAFIRKTIQRYGIELKYKTD